jgi:pimeloyl-ACP methyl ester carboxylesterase
MKTLLFALLHLVFTGAWAATCEKEDFITFVSGESQCLVMRQFGNPTPTTLVVWLHGDLSNGGPANYHFPHAERFSQKPYASQVLSVALVRPGYADGAGNESSVAFFHSQRRDHYTKVNLLEVGAAIERLKSKFKPKRVVVVGHSGGAITFASLLGLKPSLIDAAVLVGCPCDFDVWRSGRQPLAQSENPMTWVARVRPDVKVAALTGSNDDNTFPKTAESYIDALKKRQIDAVFKLLPDYSHNGSFTSPEVFKTVADFLN